MIPTTNPLAVAVDYLPVARFWRSPAWDARVERWMVLVDQVRAYDARLADALEDSFAETVAAAVASQAQH